MDAPFVDRGLSSGEARQQAIALGYSEEAARQAAAYAVGSPSPETWRRLLAQALGGVGASLVASGVVTFFAYNWDKMGRLARLGIIEGVLGALAVVAARTAGRLPARLALDVGAVLIGVLLAVFGQTYQTGADPYQLFLTWAALALPWVLVAKTEELWLLESVVMGTGLALGSSGEVVGWLILWGVASAGVAGWELQAARPRPWLTARWLPRTWAALAGGALAIATVIALLGDKAAIPTAFGALALSIAAVVLVYHLRTIDLFVQTIALGVLMVTLTTAMGRALLEGIHDFGAMLLLSLAVAGQAAAAVVWLRREARRARGAQA